MSLGEFQRILLSVISSGQWDQLRVRSPAQAGLDDREARALALLGEMGTELHKYRTGILRKRFQRCWGSLPFTTRGVSHLENEAWRRYEATHILKTMDEAKELTAFGELVASLAESELSKKIMELVRFDLCLRQTSFGVDAGVPREELQVAAGSAVWSTGLTLAPGVRIESFALDVMSVGRLALSSVPVRLVWIAFVPRTTGNGCRPFEISQRMANILSQQTPTLKLLDLFPNVGDGTIDALRSTIEDETTRLRTYGILTDTESDKPHPIGSGQTSESDHSRTSTRSSSSTR